MLRAIIIRGLPGSGKSTMAKELAGVDGVIHSTDDYRYVNGIYVYDRSKNAQNHQKCFEAFCVSLAAQIPVVIHDGVNSKLIYFTRYIQAAKRAGYEVTVMQIPHITAAAAAARNIHGLSESNIQRMIDEWEPWNE